MKRGCLMTLIAVAVLSCGPALVALAQTQPSPGVVELALVILPDAFPGFEEVKGVRGLPDGPVDLNQLNDLAPGTSEDLTEEELRSLSAYGRTWANEANDLVIIILYRLARVVDAEIFVSSVDQEVRQQFGEGGNFAVPTIPDASGKTFRPDPKSAPAHQVVFRKGRIVTQLLVLSDTGKIGVPEAITLAERQAARLPAAPADSSAEGDAATLGQQLGGAIGGAVVILGIAVLATRGAKKRREAPKPPPVPGTVLSDEPPVRVAMEPNVIRGLRRRSQIVLVLLGVDGALGLVSAFVGFGLTDRLARLKDGRPVNLDTLDSLASLHDGIVVTQLVALLVTGVAWMAWQHRAQRTLVGLSSQDDLKFTPGWAAGWWVVPLANLVMPYRTMKELYRGSAPPTSATARSRSPRALLVVWWIAFLGATVIGRYLRTLDDSLGEVVLRSRLELVIDLCYLFAAATAIGLVSLIFGGLKSQIVGEQSDTLPAADPAPAG